MQMQTLGTNTTTCCNRLAFLRAQTLGPIFTDRQSQRCDNFVMTLVILLSLKTRKHSVGCVLPACYRMGCLCWGCLPDRDPQGTEPFPPPTETPRQETPPHPGQRPPWKEHGTRDRDSLPRRNMGPVSQTGSDIIQRPLPPWTEWHMWVKTLLCPKLRLEMVTMELLQNGIATNFRVTSLFSVRMVLLASLYSCDNADSDAWCKRALTCERSLMEWLRQWW